MRELAEHIAPHLDEYGKPESDVLRNGTETIFHCHIPKTAGTSLYRYFADTLQPGACFAWNGFISPDNFRAVASRYALISGHYRNYYGDNCPNLRRITFLRQPLSRILSYYKYLRTIPRTEAVEKNNPTILMAHDMEYGDFIRSPDPLIRALVRNGITTFLLRPDVIASYGDDQDALGELAIAELANFAHVGLVERFSESLYTLCRILGLPEPSTQYQEKTSNGQINDQVVVTSADMQLLVGMNRADLMVYEYIVSQASVDNDNEQHYSFGTLPFKRVKAFRRQVVAPRVSDGAARNVLFSGWHMPDDLGVWGRSRNMTLCVDLPYPCRTIILRVVPLVAVPVPRMSMSVSVNCEITDRYIFCIPHNVEISKEEAAGASVVPTLPDQTVELIVQCQSPLSGLTRIDLVTDRAVSPASLGLSGDGRPMSIRLQSFTVA